MKLPDSPQSCFKLNNLVNEASELIRLLCSAGSWIFKKKKKGKKTGNVHDNCVIDFKEVMFST